MAMRKPGEFPPTINAVATDSVLANYSLHEIYQCLQRHLSCDWGYDDPYDNLIMDRNFQNGGTNLISAYKMPDGRNVWITTEQSGHTLVSFFDER